MSCKLEHSVDKVVIVEAIVASGRSNSNPRVMEVILGERNNGMKGINHPCIPVNLRVFKFGSKGSLMMRSCMAEKVSGDAVSIKSC